MKFCWSTLNVVDLDKSIKFYSEILGLEVSRRFKVDVSEIAFLGDGDTEIELIQIDNKNISYIGPDISWGFETKNLNKTIEILKKQNIELITDIIEPTPFIKFVMVHDPNGMKIQIVEITK